MDCQELGDPSCRAGKHQDGSHHTTMTADLIWALSCCHLLAANESKRKNNNKGVQVQVTIPRSGKPFPQSRAKYTLKLNLWFMGYSPALKGPGPVLRAAL